MQEMSFDSVKAELKVRLKDTDKVLDVGGWHSPWNRADAIVDIMPYETLNRAGVMWKDTWPTERFTKESYFQRDICSGEPLPFKDKEFDFVMCSNTLEDIRDPIQVCKEINRIGKSGLILVPSRLSESTRGTERPFYCGWYHHRWLCETEGTKITFQFKPAMLHAYRKFHFRKSPLKKVNPAYSFVGFFWKDSFDYEERVIIDRDDVQKDLMDFKKKFHGVKDVFVRKYSWLGQRL